MIDRFTDITGKPMLLLLFGYGLTNVCSECVNQYIVLDIAERLRKEGIPCDTLDLQPDWMAKRYDMTVNKDWNKEKFHVDNWMSGERTFIHALKEKGFKLILWTPCDYDLTYDAEKRYYEEHPEDRKIPLYETNEEIVLKKKGIFLEVEETERGMVIDESFPDVKRVIKMDTITIPEEPWFNHFKKFLDKGVRGIDEDGCAFLSPHIDRLYANGKDYREMHNLMQSLVSKQYYDGYREYCGKRPMIQTPTTYIGNQKWTSSWAGDVPGRELSLMGLLKYSMQGHMNFTCDMDIKRLDGIHFGFFMGWAHFRNWADMAEPWYLREDLKNAFKFYAKLRYSLLPYIYSSAYYGHTTGLSICRAMVLMYPGDPRTFNMITSEGAILDGKSNLLLCLIEKDGHYFSPHLQTGSNFLDRPGESYKKFKWPIAKIGQPKFMHKYGYYEIRCKLQTQPGWWSAFWLQSPVIGATLDPKLSGAEVDIMENFTSDGIILHNIHWKGYGDDHKHLGSGDIKIEDTPDQYHRFGCHWSPGGYVYYADGKETWRVNGPVSDIEQFILVSTECMGYRNSDQPDEELKKAVLPDYFVVDYVRVFDEVK